MRRTRIFHTESFRLAALFAVLFTGSAAILIGALYWNAQDALTVQLLASVDADISSITAAYKKEGLSEAHEIVERRIATPGYSDFFLLETKSGEKLAGNLDPIPPSPGLARIPSPIVLETDPEEQAEHVILGRGLFLSDAVYLFVGEDTFQVTEANERSLRAFGWIMGVTLALAIGGGVLLSYAFLGRIDAITRTCRAIMAGRFDSRIPTRGTSDELDRLASAINEMLDRIAALMESLQQVSNDIAHDLRTPLTRLRQKLETARLKAETPDDYAEAVDRAILDSDKILGIFSALLRISEIEKGTRLANFAALDLAHLLREVGDIYAPVAEDNGQHLNALPMSSLMIEGDRLLLLQMFSNLIENAIRHTQPGTRIAVQLVAEDTEAVVRILDSGPGIPCEERENVFRRFYRLGASRQTPGNGLGLALVAAIATLHRAAVELSDNGPGLRVTLRFPVE